MRPVKYSMQRTLHRALWLRASKSFVCFTAICLGRGMAKITHSLLLLIPLFHRNVLGSCFHWKWWHNNKCVRAWQSLPHLFPSDTQPAAKMFGLPTKTKTAQAVLYLHSLPTKPQPKRLLKMLCLIFKVVVHDQRKPQEQHSPFPSHSLKQLRESYHHVPFHLWWHVKGRRSRKECCP